ncbi:MAG: gliding motility-associated-like protein, partial [Saprospiraceae bacterium]
GNSSDREITETEFFTLVGTSSRGCDSTINLTLTQVSVGPPTLIEAICFGENVQVGNSIYTESGFYADTLSSSFGCDSIVRLDLDVRPQYINDLALTICTDGSITVGDSVITEVGFYAITISSVDGCDSLLNVTLSIGDAFITPLNVRICSGDEFIVGNSTYNSSGSYSDTIQSFAGCDSIINLELFVLEVQRTQLDTTICAGETLELDGNMFSTSIMDSVTILSSEGCDSIIIDFNLTVLNEINTVTNHNICPGESIRVGTSTYDMAGTYMDTIIASTGCDSIIRSIVSARDSIIVTLNQQICNGGSFTVGSSNYSAAGDYQDILLSNTGCDSIVMLSLEVVDQIETNIVVTICIGESYGFDGQDLTASGQYLDTLSSNLGCDSIVTLDLTVAPELAIIIENIIGSCEGVANGAFIIRDISGATPPFAVSGLPDISTIDMLPFTVTGLNPQTYSIDIADANGCTATIDVVITEDRNSAVTINATTIDPTGLYELSLEVNGTIGSIAWDNIPGLSCYECIDPMADILERTTFRVVVTDVDGCISMAEITLDVNGIGNIYVPNIFNPESRIGNHRFFIQGEDDSEAIYDLQIYDRWGSLIFGTIGATLSDPDFGWDGTMGGRRLNADVYIYSGRVYDVNGSVQLINGDLTMLK